MVFCRQEAGGVCCVKEGGMSSPAVFHGEGLRLNTRRPADGNASGIERVGKGWIASECALFRTESFPAWPG